MDQNPTRAIYFHGADDHATAKDLARAEAHGGKRAITRDASVYVSGEVEPCKAIYLLPSVRDWDMARIVASYEPQGVQIERLLKNDAPKVKAATPAPDAPSNVPPLPPPPKNEALRRLPTTQLKSLAVGRGIDISTAPDRATIIAAIEAAAQKGATP